MYLESDKDIETYREAFHSGLRSEQIYGYVGKIRKSSTFYFYVTNRRHYFRDTREMVGGNLPISVYIYGKATASSSGVTMEAGFWYGVAVWEYLLLYGVTFLLCLLCLEAGDSGVSPAFAALCALGVTLVFAFISAVCSGLTLLGGDDKRELEEFLERTLEQDD